MKQFIKKILVLGMMFCVMLYLLIIASSKLVESRSFENWNTESNLFLIKKDKHYDQMFLGISHARNFSRHRNHQRVEQILNKDIINLGRGYALCGTGVLNEYVKYFYNNGNSTDEIIYFISSPVFYADFLDISSKVFEEEPISLSFLIQYLQSENRNKWQQSYFYLASKLKYEWLIMTPKRDTANLNRLIKIDEKIVKEGFKKAYLETLQEDIFNENKHNIDQLVKMAKENNSKVLFVIPPALFGEWKGHDNVLEYIAEKSNLDSNVSYFDFATVIDKPGLYYDHHHLNTKGVVVFIEQYLKSAIN